MEYDEFSSDELIIADTIKSFFNSARDLIKFNSYECSMFANEIAYEGFSCKIEGDHIVFKNPFVTDENCTWTFNNTLDGRLDFVKDLLKTHQELRHKNNHDKALNAIIARLSDEREMKVKEQIFKLLNIRDIKNMPAELNTMAAFDASRTVFRELVNNGISKTCMSEVADFYRNNGAFVKQKKDGVNWMICFNEPSRQKPVYYNRER